MINMGCGIDMHKVLLSISMCFVCVAYDATGQKQPGTLADRDGNVYSIKVMPDKKTWMTSNLTIRTAESYVYENPSQSDRYGRLYTWKSAHKGCKLLGEGWRLPTNYEWQEMAKCFGGVRDDAEDGGKKAYQALIDGGAAAFNAVHGGSRDANDSSYARVDAHGFYWTATETAASSAWFYNFGRNANILNRHPDGRKDMAMSVRCVRDMGE